MTIDFSKCSDDDVAELMIAATQECLWLCWKQHNSCKLGISGNICPAGINRTGMCDAFSNELIDKKDIFRQCWEEIERRARG